jgi:ferrochelatase
LAEPGRTGDDALVPLDADAVLLVSFGGPEGMDDVMPFLRNVTRGRGIPDERLATVAAQYELFGGVSPLNASNRALVAALEAVLEQSGPALPVYWGNRNWDPYLRDAVAAMQADGVQRALAFTTSAFSSYSGCRQYREDIGRAREEVGSGAPEILKLRPYFDHPGFIEPMAANVSAALRTLPAALRTSARLVFTAHSIPTAMAATSDYEVQLRAAAGLVADRVPGSSAGTSSSRAGAGRRPSPGSSPTSWPTSRPSTATCATPWWWSRSASPRTTTRSASTSTSRPAPGPTSSGSRWRGRRPSAPTPRSSP